MIPSSRARVRARIAARFAARNDTTTIGSVVLRDAQSEAVRRARIALGRFRGVMIADDVGTGKTFIALTLVAPYANRLVVAPATLRAMWEDAARRASIEISFMSIESLPGCREIPEGHDVVLIDEAHHFRNPATQRYAVARKVLAGADAILLSATPVHNTPRELDAQLALFLGADARDLDNETRAIAIVRGVDTFDGPSVIVHPPFPIPDVGGILQAIRALPAPVAPVDGGNAPALVQMGFLRAWCSSREATFAMVRRAHHRGAALRDALASGAELTKRELRTWIGSGEDQLGFTELLAERRIAVPDMRRARAYVEALEALRVSLVSLHWIDDDRATLIRKVVAMHTGVPVLVCSQYTATIDAMWTRLRMLPGVAALTSKGARIASGPVTREQALERFAPNALRARPPHARERIGLLLATDLVSEGLNLHDAGVIVHLDLPWTSARLAQRVGRIARFGSPHAMVHTYTVSPPRAADALLKLERRIETKRRIAAQLVGGAQRAHALLGGQRQSTVAAPESQSRIVELLRPWAVDATDEDARACGINAPQGGWLALVANGDEARLVARVGRGAPTTDPAIVLRAVEWLVARDEHWLPASWPSARREAERWIARQRGRQLSGAFRHFAAVERGHDLAARMRAMALSLPHERARVATSASHFHRSDARHAPRITSLLALVVFCRGDKPRQTNSSAVRP